MRRLIRVLLIAACVPVALLAQSQQLQVVGTPDVRIFTLQYLSNSDAAKLVAPFVQGLAARWDVYESGPAVRGITVRASKDVLGRVDSILKANDRPPTTITLRFQIIAAVDSTGRDSAIPAEVETTLKDLFKFGGYRLLSQGSTTVGADNFKLTMNGEPPRYFNLSGTVHSIRVQPSKGDGMGSAAAQLYVSLQGQVEQGASMQWVSLLSTTLSVPIGQTVVLGSAAGNRGQRALILTVRPEIVPAR